MARPRGYPKTGGRKPGTLNKRSEDAIQKLEENDLDPLEKLIASARKYMENDEQEKADNILLQIMPYAYPKLRSQEVDIGVNNDELANRLQRARELNAQFDHQPSAPQPRPIADDQAQDRPARLTGPTNGGNEPATDSKPADRTTREPASSDRRPLPGQAPTPSDQALAPETTEPSPDWDYTPGLDD